MLSSPVGGRAPVGWELWPALRGSEGPFREGGLLMLFEASHSAERSGGSQGTAGRYLQGC